MAPRGYQLAYASYDRCYLFAADFFCLDGEVSDFLAMKLPTGAGRMDSSVIIEPLVLTVAVAGEGCEIVIGQAESVMVSDAAVEDGLAQFATMFKQISADQKRHAGDPVEIKCDDDVKWDHLVKIYNVLQAMGMDDITFHMNE